MSGRKLRIAIVGAGGFVGSRLAGTMKKMDGTLDVLPLSKAAYDLLDPATWTSLPSAVDCVIHAAAVASGAPYDVYNLNALSSVDFGYECRTKRIGKVIYLSSGAVYGPTSAATTPDTPCNPVGDYAVSKYLAERKLAETLADRLTILRLYFPYGGRQHPSRVFMRLLNAVRSGAEITCNGDGGPRLTASHVDDICAALIRDFVLGEAPGGVFNLASDQVVSIEDIARSIGRYIRREPRFRRTGASPDCVSAPYLRAAWRRFDAADIVDET